jgi:hypothetical protein
MAFVNYKVDYSQHHKPAIVASSTKWRSDITKQQLLLNINILFSTITQADCPWFEFLLMSSHAPNYDLTAPYTNIALFGANGQIGERILQALLSCKRHVFKVTAFIPPDSVLPQSSNANVDVKTFDIEHATRESLAKDLDGVEAIVSALNGPALEAQATIQDAAADVGVKRFYPSEYEFHQIYRKPNDPMGYIHPAWNTKDE